MVSSDTEPESYVDRFQRLGQRTYFFFLALKLLGPSPPPAFLFSEEDFNTELQRSPSCKDCKVKKEEARNDREGCETYGVMVSKEMMSDGEQGRRRPVHTAAAPV
ncbi:hypothetical protein Rs2_49708 [Raphanus sativus]|nr:hypothetical protein Rs2_49708 [Raphanus sativus]